MLVFFFSYHVVFVLFGTASYIGLKEFVPPYLDPILSLEELMTGVSFASGGSGLDPLTAQISVSLSQMNFFIIVIYLSIVLRILRYNIDSYQLLH